MENGLFVTRLFSVAMSAERERSVTRCARGAGLDEKAALSFSCEGDNT